jgi:2-polyprenyl-3-methyl-5-hydroxy-6-metoxy-1,4-benzoquinol methylase
VSAPSSAFGSVQHRSQGISPVEIGAAALALAEPTPGLSWLDIGAGTGELLRLVRDRWSPSRLVAVDVIDWLAPDLRPEVEQILGDAVLMVAQLEPVDRVLCVETLEHVDAPWWLLRRAARLLRPDGILVLSTPNIVTLRHRLELMVRGQLTAYRPHELQHLTPVLSHVSESILREEGLHDIRQAYAGRDVIPFVSGRRWPAQIVRRAPRLLNISTLTVARRPSASASASA